MRLDLPAVFCLYLSLVAATFLPLNVVASISNSGGVAGEVRAADVVADVVDVVVLLLGVGSTARVDECKVVEEGGGEEGEAEARVVK